MVLHVMPIRGIPRAILRTAPRASNINSAICTCVGAVAGSQDFLGAPAGFNSRTIARARQFPYPNHQVLQKRPQRTLSIAVVTKIYPSAARYGIGSPVESKQGLKSVMGEASAYFIVKGEPWQHISVSGISVLMASAMLVS